MRTLLLSIMLVTSVPTITKSRVEKTRGPDCSGGWPTKMALGLLMNAGLAENYNIDFTKTRTLRLASEKTGIDLWHQVYHVVFTTKSGDTIQAIAVHDASEEECSMTGVELFVVSKILNPERK